MRCNVYKILVYCGLNEIDYFTPWYGHYDEYHLFEAHPSLSKKLKEDLPEDENIFFHDKAVWVEDTKLKFYIGDRGNGKPPLGSTLLKGKTTGRVDYTSPTVVNAINFDKYLKSLPAGEIYLKMDIEGAEFKVLNHMNYNGSLDIIDILEVEFHAYKFYGLEMIGAENDTLSMIKEKVPKVIVHKE